MRNLRPFPHIRAINWQYNSDGRIDGEGGGGGRQHHTPDKGLNETISLYPPLSRHVLVHTCIHRHKLNKKKRKSGCIRQATPRLCPKQQVQRLARAEKSSIQIHSNRVKQNSAAPEKLKFSLRLFSSVARLSHFQTAKANAKIRKTEKNAECFKATLPVTRPLVGKCYPEKKMNLNLGQKKGGSRRCLCPRKKNASKPSSTFIKM